MKKTMFLSFVFLCVTSTVFAATSKAPVLDPLTPQSIDPAKEKEIRANLPTLQIPFIKNESQIDSRVKYYAPTFTGTVFVTDDSITYALKEIKENKEETPRGWVIKESFLNAKDTKVKGQKASETRVSYFKGKDRRNWKSNIATYSEIGLGEIYDHIRLHLKAYGKNIEKIFLVERGGNPEAIAIEVEGAKGLKVNGEGELEIATGMGTVKMTTPVAYQEVNNKRVEVAVAYNIQESGVRSQESKNCFDISSNHKSHIPHHTSLSYGFEVGEYNKDYPLIIDPLLASTFIGGGSLDWAHDLAIDSSGNVFVTGWTRSSDYPTTTGAYDESYNGGDYDVFVSKLSNDLSTLSASTFIGGSSKDGALDLIIVNENIFLYGETESSDYPTTAGAYDESHNGGFDVVVSELTNSLSILLASTFIGGSGDDRAEAIVVDQRGSFETTTVIIAGWTDSSDYPTTPGAFDESYNGGGDFPHDGFLSRISDDLSTLSASTFIGGSGMDWGQGLVMDASNNLFVVGTTDSSDFPTTAGAYDESHNSNWDIYVAKLTSDLSTLFASTFIGGSSIESGEGIVIDSSGNVFVTGYAMSSDYPTTPGAFDESHNGGFDVVVSKLSNDLSTLSASTVVGGSSPEQCSINSPAMDSSGNIFVAGNTMSSDYPTITGAYDESHNGDNDVLVSKLSNDLSTLLASTFIGGSSAEVAFGVALDSSGSVFVAGYTGSAGYPTTAGAYDVVHNGDDDVFVSKLDSDLSATPTTTTSTITTTTTTKSPFDTCTATSIYGEDSEEVILLRYLRDSALSKTPEGRELIRLYYEWSPAMVKAMENDEGLRKEIKKMIDGILILMR